MEKKVFTMMLMLLSMTAVVVSGCSSDDDFEKFDASLLPGYWVLVKDGESTKSGVWFSNELYDGEMWKDVANVKLVKFWRMSTDSIAQTKETTFWEVLENGYISIGPVWESARSVIKLTKDELVIRETHFVDDGKTDRYYKRLQKEIVISE